MSREFGRQTNSMLCLESDILENLRCAKINAMKNSITSSKVDTGDYMQEEEENQEICNDESHSCRVRFWDEPHVTRHGNTQPVELQEDLHSVKGARPEEPAYTCSLTSLMKNISRPLLLSHSSILVGYLTSQLQCSQTTKLKPVSFSNFQLDLCY